MRRHSRDEKRSTSGMHVKGGWGGGGCGGGGGGKRLWWEGELGEGRGGDRGGMGRLWWKASRERPIEGVLFTATHLLWMFMMIVFYFRNMFPPNLVQACTQQVNYNMTITSWFPGC